MGRFRLPIWHCMMLLMLASAAHGATASPESTAAATASPEAVPGGMTLNRYEYIDPSGLYTDDSGNQTIWTTFPAGQHATLTIQVEEGRTHLPIPVPGHRSQRAGLPGVRIYVDSEPEGITFYPADGYENWLTDENGLFAIRVPVPHQEGEYSFIFKTVNPEVHTHTLSIAVKSPNWILWLVLGMLGGLSLFLYGMQVATEGLQDSAGSRFRETLRRVTKSPVRGVATGTVLTVFTQSSSATTVMLVGFVRAGLMSFRETLGPIFGAAIGTTLTVQLLSFKIQTFSLPLMAIGFLMMFFAGRSSRTVAIGKVIFGFGMIFFGMAVMSEVIEPLKTSPAFSEALARITGRPLWCLIIVTIFTAVIQSSGASIGIALTLANQGLLDIHQAIPIIFGANIGTCITAIFASIGGTADAKRVALAHLLYKIITVAIFYVWFMPRVLAWMSIEISDFMAMIFPGASFLANTTARQMANAHTIIAVLGALLGIFVLMTPLEKAVVWLTPAGNGDKREAKPKHLDDALLSSPHLALGATVREISRMGRHVEEMVKRSQQVLVTRDEETLMWLRRRDDKVDRSFHHINAFLTELTARKPGREELNRAIGLLYIINDLESIGDLVVKILVPIIDKLIDQDLKFSAEGMADLQELHTQVLDSLTKVMVALTNPEDSELCNEIIMRQEEFQVAGRRLHLRHLKRLQAGTHESVETSSVHLDVINYLLRMHYHIYSIAWTASRGVSAHEELP